MLFAYFVRLCWWPARRRRRFLEDLRRFLEDEGGVAEDEVRCW